MGEWKQLPKTLNTSGISQTSDNIPIPNVRIEAMMLVVKYTVTDPGIGAGENFEGCLDKIELGSGSATFFEARRDELSMLVDYINPGISTGAYVDGLPVTTVEQTVYYLIPGPFRLQDVRDPRLYLNLRTITDEFGGAVAFVSTMTVFVDIADDADGHGFVYRRNSFATATQHRLTTPRVPFVDLITGAFVTLGSAVMDDITYQAHDLNGNDILGQDAIDLDMAEVGMMHYAAFKETAMAAGTPRYLFGTIENPPGDSDIIVDCTATATCTGWVQGLKKGTARKV